MSVPARRGDGALLDVDGPHYRWPVIDDELSSMVDRQLHRSLSDRDASGVIGEFEQAFAQFVGSPFAVSFSSGTSAIHAMSRICGLKPGDAVIAPAYTFPATASPFAFDGVEVRFADANAYGNVTAETLERAFSPNVRAVIITHMWGIPCEMDGILNFCHDRGLLLLEDCSHAHFASYRGSRVGTTSHMAVFSTNQKAITTGEGGVLVTADDRCRELATLYAHYNKRSKQEIDPSTEYYPFAFTGMGLKQRMTTLGAAIGIHQLARAHEIETRRRRVLAEFVGALADNPLLDVLTVPEHLGENGLYVIGMTFRADDSSVTRDEFVRLAVANGALEVDVPGSTRDISLEPLFARRDPFAPWCAEPRRPAAALPGVAKFQSSFLKVPAWGYEGDEEIVSGYVRVLNETAEAVAR